MSKQIQAYFRTENEAEGARTTLQTYKTEHLEVGQLHEELGRGANIIVPLVPWNVSGVGGSVTGAGPVGSSPAAPGAVVETRASTGVERSEDQSTTEQDDWVDGAELTDSDYKDLRYVLSAKVDDTDYEEIVRILRTNNAYVERFE